MKRIAHHSTSWLGALALAGTLGCGANSGHLGVAFLRLTDQVGPCNIQKDPVGGGPVIPTNVEFRRERATAAFQGGSQWTGGDLVAVAWKEGDGTIGRFYLDVSPERGFGVSAIPNDTAFQGLGLVLWNGARRTFAATAATGIITYSGAKDSGLAQPPGVLFVHAGIDGVGPNNEPRCEILALHAAPDHERTEPYDPLWLVPNPTSLIVDGPRKSAPTFSGDHQPTANLLAPAAAQPDPGGAAPSLLIHSFTTFGTGAGGDGNACD